MDISLAMQRLRPGAQWRAGDSYESLKMLDDTEKPTKAALEAASAEMVKERGDAAAVLKRLRPILATFTAGEIVAYQGATAAVKQALEAGDVTHARAIIATYPGVETARRKELLAAFNS